MSFSFFLAMLWDLYDPNSPPGIKPEPSSERDSTRGKIFEDPIWLTVWLDIEWWIGNNFPSQFKVDCVVTFQFCCWEVWSHLDSWSFGRDLYFSGMATGRTKWAKGNQQRGTDYTGPHQFCGGFFVVFFFGSQHDMQDLSPPNKRSNLCHLQWGCRVLTTGPPGKSLVFFLLQMSEQGATAYLWVKEVYYLTYQKWVISAAAVRLQLKRMEMTRGQSKGTDQISIILAEMTA